MGVYIIESNGKYKIGITQYVGQRIRALQTGNASKIQLVAWLDIKNSAGKTLGSDRVIEQQIHSELRYCVEQGEWFSLSRMQLQAIIKKYHFIDYSSAKSFADVVHVDIPDLSISDMDINLSAVDDSTNKSKLDSRASIHLNFWVSQDLMDKLKLHALKSRRTIRQVATEALEAYLFG